MAARRLFALHTAPSLPIFSCDAPSALCPPAIWRDRDSITVMVMHWSALNVA